MRIVDNANNGWLFKKGQKPENAEMVAAGDWEEVDLPHTWNNIDGNSGDVGYYRNECTYTKIFDRPKAPEQYKFYLEFEGVNSIARVFVNGQFVKEHRGGYSAFRVDLTDALNDGPATVTVGVDNRNYDDVYPQVADFTFYGGIYRNVKLISVSPTHFDLDFYGAPGLAVDAEVKGNDAKVNLRTWVTDPQWSDQVHYKIYNATLDVVAEVTAPAKEANTQAALIPDVHLWQGTEDPYLYTVVAEIVRGNEVIDQVKTQLGVREYEVDPDKGFILNGKPTPLRGVSRHQDRMGKGNALKELDMEEDVAIIQELGANTIRLAHYQQNQYFYHLCDEAGFVIWAEIPFISVFNADPGARDNTIQQMKELIYQSYNHPSICFWGISNEITIGGEKDALYDNLVELNDLVHELDPTRKTTMAQLSSLPVESKQNQLTDVVSYNHYFGWYGGDFDKNEEWFDAFHEKYPDRPIGISEYGCEGIINWHTDTPTNQDYSEEYQTLYHEHMAKMISERPYLWATHIWNMFDFGAANRDEGGVKSRNNKGLVTFDRKIRKDSFYVYKAYWSDEAFVHIAGRRYANRPYGKMDVKVYSNQPEVTLYVNGEAYETQENDKIFIFKDVPLNAVGEPTFVEAKAEGTPDDTVTFTQVSEPDPSYTRPEEEVQEGGAKNWFEGLDTSTENAPDYTFDPDYYSIKDRTKDLLANEETTDILESAMHEFTTGNYSVTILNMYEDMPLDSVIDSFLTDDDNVHKIVNAELQKVKKEK